MKKNKDSDKDINLEEEKKIIKALYALMAIMFVLIPEWMAEQGIKFNNLQFDGHIPEDNNLISKNPYLYVTSINVKELRNLARKLNIQEYSRESKEILTKRVLRKLKKKNPKKFLSIIKRCIRLYLSNYYGA